MLLVPFLNKKKDKVYLSEVLELMKNEGVNIYQTPDTLSSVKEFNPDLLFAVFVCFINPLNTKGLYELGIFFDKKSIKKVDDLTIYVEATAFTNSFETVNIPVKMELTRDLHSGLYGGKMFLNYNVGLTSPLT